VADEPARPEPGSRAEPDQPTAPTRPAEPITAPDPNRRRFFRQFAGDVMTSVGSVIGAAQLLQQESAQAARELLGDPEAVDAGAVGPGAAVPAAPEGPREERAAGAGFRAPMRWDGDVCRVVDQRRLPDVLVDIEVRGGGDGVAAIRDEAIVGSPAQAQLGAVTIALTAGKLRTHRPFARRATIRGAANALRNVRPGSAAMHATVARMLVVEDRLGIDSDGETIAAALRVEAEAIIADASAAHGALVTHALGLLDALRGEGETPLRLLTTGSTGPMGGGQYGTALSAIIAAHHADRPVEALVAETRPGFEGSRIAAWELHEAGVPHAVVTDAAAPGRIAAGEVDAVLVGADRIAANGDVIAVAGTYPLALAASAAGIPFFVCVASIALDGALADGASRELEDGRPGPVLAAAGTRVAPEGTRIRNPVQDVTPFPLVTAIVTEHGALRPPFASSIAAVLPAQPAAAEPAANPPPADTVPSAAEAVG
jgi:eIF-2B alpha/beta/delta-like uncharacterized protein